MRAFSADTAVGSSTPKLPTGATKGIAAGATFKSFEDEDNDEDDIDFGGRGS